MTFQLVIQLSDELKDSVVNKKYKINIEYDK